MYLTGSSHEQPSKRAMTKQRASSPDNKSGGSAAKNQDLVKRFTWEIASINVYLQEIHYFWATTLGVSGPQWIILMALGETDTGNGVSVKTVSRMIHVDPSFVTTQSKLLEKKSLIRRKTSEDDARVVKMSLTDKTYKHMASLAAQQEALNEFIFAEFADRELNRFINELGSLKERLEKASLKVSMNI
jgi:DNA-binding MarR family transcriptional regulator